jgi:hypothetical protein
MNPQDVTPSEHADFFETPIRRLQSTYACILAVDEQGRSVTKGTAVFVSVGPQKLLVTARHVVRSEKLVGRSLLLMLSRLGPDGLAVVGEQTVPLTVPLELETVWESEPLDVSFIRAPDILAAMAEARFFDGAFHAEAATGLRGSWREHHSDTTSLPYFVLGFPNFGHLIENVQRRVETLSTTALPAYVTQLDPHPWDGHSTPAPQLWLEVDAREDGLAIGAISSSMQRVISNKLFHPSADDPEPLGGFSGGPVVVVGSNGEFLLGIIKEGTEVFGSLRVAASCWDDCLSAYARSASVNV